MNDSNLIETAKTLTYGTELEYTNICRSRAAKAIQSVVGGTIEHVGGSYDTWTVTARDGKVWKAVSDASLGNKRTSSEIVTPILRWEDMETLQEVVRALRHAGAQTPSCTSQHVHIGVEDFTAKQIANFARIWYKQEAIILKALATLPSRLAHYTKPTDREFIARLENAKPENRDDLNKAWFGYYNPNPYHYDSNRYHAINLNNVWRTGTVEIRAFNGTTHAGEVKSHIQLALMIAAKAKTAKCASAKDPRTYNADSAAYDMRVFMIHLGMNGDEFKTARHHLLKHLEGNTSRRAAA